MNGFDARPRREDFFPSLRRGHGTAHRPEYSEIIDGRRVYRDNVRYTDNPCCDSTCSLHQPKSKNVHSDARANLRDWCEERGLPARAIKNSPVRAMYFATCGLRYIEVTR